MKSRKLNGTLASVATLAFLLTGCTSTGEYSKTESPSHSIENEQQATEKPTREVAPVKFDSDNPFLGGPASPQIDTGEINEISVVDVGPLLKKKNILLFSFRNNTNEAISHVDWTATAKSNGSLIGSGSSQGTTPSQINPGEAGLAYIYFENSSKFPKDTEYDFKVSTSSADPTPFNTAPFTIDEVNIVGGSIVGSATNKTGSNTTGPYSVSVYCFEEGKLRYQDTDYAEESSQDTASGESVTFSTKIYGHECKEFILGVSGYFS